MIEIQTSIHYQYTQSMAFTLGYAVYIIYSVCCALIIYCVSAAFDCFDDYLEALSLPVYITDSIKLTVHCR